MGNYSNEAYRDARGPAVDELRKEVGRGMTITGNEESPEQSVVELAAKEVDEERRDIDEVMERMRSRQKYFYEKAQMHREASEFYTRMHEDIAELMDNGYVSHANKAEKKAMN